MSDRWKDREAAVRNSDLDTLMAQMTERRLQKLRDVASNRQRGLTIAMNYVKNAHNLSAISRTAESFGVQLIHFTAPDYFDPKKSDKSVSKASNKWIDYQYHDSIEACIDHLHGQRTTIAAMVVSDRARTVYDVEWAQYDELALLIGNEHEGLSDVAAESVDLHITIPMRGMAESLNVSVAVAIALSEVTRQREATSKSYQLSEDEIELLFREFVRRAATKWHEWE